jgi:hypothetical protein
MSALLLALLFRIEKSREDKNRRFVRNSVFGKEEFSFADDAGNLRIIIAPETLLCDVYVNGHRYHFDSSSGAAKLIEELYRDQERSPSENPKP